MSLPPATQNVPPQPKDVSGLDEEDAILSNNIEARLRDFLSKEDTDLSYAGELMSQSYEGNPDAVRTLMIWTSQFSDQADSVLHQATEMAVLNLESRLIPLLNTTLTRTDYSLSQIADICASVRWNPFFTVMAKRHPTSGLCSVMKREEQLAAVAVQKASLETPEAFCEEFQRLLISSVSDSRTEFNLSTAAFFKRFSVLCAYDESVTKTALFLLSSLSKKAHHALTRQFYRHLAQHVRKEAVCAISDIRPSHAADIIPDVPGKLSLNQATMHVAKLMVLADCVATDLVFRATFVDAVLTVVMSKKDVGDFRTAKPMKSELDIVTIAYSLMIGSVVFRGVTFTQRDVSADLVINNVREKSLFIRMLCHNEVLDGLFEAAFSSDRRPTREDNMNAAKKRCLCILLSFALSFVEIEDCAMVQRLESEVDCRQMRATVLQMFERIELLVSTCETLKPGTPRFLVNEEATQTLVAAARDPFIARGVLIWASDCLKGGSNLRDLRMTAKVHLAFLTLIADKHVALRSDVVDAIGRAMVREYPGLVNTEVVDLQTLFMNCLIGLIEYNMAYLVAKAFVDYMADRTSIDLSHLRRFVSVVLSTVLPPFSNVFSECMMTLLKHPRLSSVLREKDMAALVAKFQHGMAKVIVL